ncbi:RDD family protein [Actinoplanes sp. KI2]|uniref:RDD family protein n=1 Tax=Actinoplanes sp. KI2 TaxID=2983315 RepID=UPI0021D5DABC|nr:RDD family protein [Actinoplanes sp. KI2]MCU7725999.1 RDD family protein [Actinoplanes sp. KI2]
MSATAADRPAMAAASPAGFAGVVSRTIAYVVDSLIVSVASVGTATGMSLIASVLGSDAHALAKTLTTVYLAVLPAVFALYCAVFWGLTGRTPGMALAGVRVVNMSRGRVRWIAALARGILLAYFPIGALWMLVDRRHRAIHDLIARTLVVRL